MRGDALDLLAHLIRFLLDRLPIRQRVSEVRRLDCELAHALQAHHDRVEAALGGLGDRDTIARVADRLLVATHLRRQTLGNGQSRRIVLGAVDAQA